MCSLEVYEYIGACVCVCACVRECMCVYTCINIFTCLPSKTIHIHLKYLPEMEDLIDLE